MAAGRFHIGTSGYSYKEWKGAFYPEKLAAKNYLQFYADQLSSVEINNTFYRFPSETMLQGWVEQTPETFTFAVKAVQGITHKARLKDVSELTRDFIQRCQQLGQKLGPILFQLPPNLKRDDERLDAFLAVLPEIGRYAMEFRHESWLDDSVFERLENRGVALVLSEGEKLDTPRRVTAPFVYARLRKEEYSDAELMDWHGFLHAQGDAGRDVYAYLKHDEAGVSPAHALRLLAGREE